MAAKKKEDEPVGHIPKVKDPESVLGAYKSDESHINYVRTGVLAADLLTAGKGWPLSRLIHIWAEPGLGKSTLMYTVVRNLIKRGESVLWVGVEPTQDLAESMGLRNGGQDIEGFTYVDCSFWDDLLKVSSAFLSLEGVRWMVIDSLSAVTPDLEKIMKDGLEAATIAVDARIQKNYLRAFHALLKEADKSIIYVTHASTKIAMKYGEQTKVVAQGGFSTQHFSDFRIMLKGAAQLQAEDLGETGSKRVIGTTAYLMAEKNRHANPFAKIPVSIIFGKGLSNIKSMVDYAVWRGFVKGKGWYECAISFASDSERDEPQKGQGMGFVMQWVKERSAIIMDDFYTHAVEYFEAL
jgi:recombination protein RecA